jgi:hypothetical protein
MSLRRFAIERIVRSRRDHHVDSSRPDRLTVEPFALLELAQKAAYVPVVDRCQLLLRYGRGKE